MTPSQTIRVTQAVQRDYNQAVKIADMNAVAGTRSSRGKPRKFLAAHRGFYIEHERKMTLVVEPLGRASWQKKRVHVPTVPFARRALNHLRSLAGVKSAIKAQKWLMTHMALAPHLKIADKRPITAEEFTGRLQSLQAAG